MPRPAGAIHLEQRRLIAEWSSNWLDWTGRALCALRTLEPAPWIDQIRVPYAAVFCRVCVHGPQPKPEAAWQRGTVNLARLCSVPQARLPVHRVHRVHRGHRGQSRLRYRGARVPPAEVPTDARDSRAHCCPVAATRVAVAKGASADGWARGIIALLRGIALLGGPAQTWRPHAPIFPLTCLACPVVTAPSPTLPSDKARSHSLCPRDLLPQEAGVRAGYMSSLDDAFCMCVRRPFLIPPARESPPCRHQNLREPRAARCCRPSWLARNPSLRVCTAYP